MALIIAGASPSRRLGVRPHLCRRLVDYWRIYRYEWRQWRNFLGRLCNNWKWRWHGGGQIRVRLVFRPPMQVLLESVVACHWAQALQRMGIVEQLSYQVDLWLGHRVTVGSGDTSERRKLYPHWIGLICSLWWFDGAYCRRDPWGHSHNNKLEVFHVSQEGNEMIAITIPL